MASTSVRRVTRLQIVQLAAMTTVIVPMLNCIGAQPMACPRVICMGRNAGIRGLTLSLDIFCTS